MAFADSHELTRRLFARLLAGGALAPLCGAAPFERHQDPSATLNLETGYRADAQILLLGLPLLRRQNVGGGRAVWCEFEGVTARRTLEFTGFSSPERAAGLNRMGFIQEVAHEAQSGGACTYFGVMSSSPEETPDQARQALHEAAKEQPYTAVEGRIAIGASETATAHFTAPPASSAERRAELIESARRALASVKKVSADPGPEPSQSFLQALAGMLLRPDQHEGRYIFMGRAYGIRLSGDLDRKAQLYFRQRGLIAENTAVTRISGRVWRESGGKETEFHLWIPDGVQRPIPLRIEYQPKSYLRLTFESATDL